MRNLDLPLEDLSDAVRRLRAQHELPLKTPLGRDDLVYQVVNSAAEVATALAENKALAQAANTVFSIDPSSTCTGWAAMRPQLKLVASGRLLPPDTKATHHHHRVDHRPPGRATGQGRLAPGHLRFGDRRPLA